MLRIVFFLALIAAAALGATWIAEQGGGIALSWGVWRVETSLPVFILVFAIALAVAMLAWSILRGIWRAPARLSQFRQRRRAARGREGQTLVEFGIVVALVALAAMAAVKLFGTEIANMFGRLLQKITGVG